MSSPAGPIVPLRTGRRALRPPVSSVRVNVFPLLSLIRAAVCLRGPRRDARAHTTEKRGYMVRAPNQGATSYSRVGRAGGESVAALRRGRRASRAHRVATILDLRASLLRARRGRVLAAELVDAARGVDDLLLAGIERMAVRAHLHLEVVSERRARLERVTARAGDRDLSVLRMGLGFHGATLR